MIQEGGLDFFDTLEHDETINSSQKDYLLSFLEKNEHEIEFKFLDKAEKEPKPEQQKKVIVSPLDELFD
jgi:hypothetical protein